MSEMNVESTNEVTEPSAEPEGNEDVQDNSIDSSDEDMTGAEAMEIEKKAKEAGKTMEEYMKQRKAEKKAEKKAPPAKAAVVPKEPAVKEPAKQEAAPVKYKVKANGEEKEVDIEELKSAYSLAAGARKTMQEGLNARNQALEAIKILKNKDTLWEALEKLGYDPDQLAEDRMVARAEREILTPEERETREKLKKLQAYEEMEAAQKKAQEEKEISEAKQKFAQDFERDFTAALRTVAIPPTRTAIARVARKIQVAAKMGKELSPVEAARRVKADLQKEWELMYGEADDDTLYNLVGDKNSERILKHRAKQLHNTTNYNSNPSVVKKERQVKDSGYSWNNWKEEKYKK